MVPYKLCGHPFILFSRTRIDFTDTEGNTVAVATGWQQTRATSLASTGAVIPGTATVVAVASLPLAVSTTSTTGNGVVTAPNQVTVQPASAATTSNDTNNQETSIFIEAMEAIFNSQL